MKRALLACALAALWPASAHAANILFVADGTGDLELVGALRREGHTITQVAMDYSRETGTNARLMMPLDEYDAVYWSATGVGAELDRTDQAVFDNLREFVTRGGRLFITGYDSVASPDNPRMWDLLGGTGAMDVPRTPGPIIDEANSLTVGVGDIRGVMPSSVGDMDCLMGLGEDTIAVVSSVRDPDCALWVLRALGDGEIAWISSSNSTAFWSSETSPYNIAARNFVSRTDTTTIEDGAPLIQFEGPYAIDEGSALTVTARVSDREGDTFSFSWDLDDDGNFGEAPGDDTFTLAVGTTDGDRSLRIGVEARDRDGHTSTRHRTIQIANIAPMVTSRPPRVASVDTNLQYAIRVFEPAGANDMLTFSLVRGPPSMQVTAGGVVQWTPLVRDITPPDVTVPVEVSIDDGDGGTTTHAWEMIVSRNRQPSAPEPAYPIEMIALLERAPRLAAANSEDLDLDTLMYFFEIDAVPTFDSSELRSSGPIEETPGFTAWQLEEPLAPGRRYYWRVWSNDGLFDSDIREESFWVVRDPSEMPDAGPVMISDGGLIPGVDAGMSGGGGCSASGARSASAWWLLAIPLALVMRRRWAY
jgi:hypothetical protein